MGSYLSQKFRYTSFALPLSSICLAPALYNLFIITPLSSLSSYKGRGLVLGVSSLGILDCLKAIG